MIFETSDDKEKKHTQDSSDSSQQQVTVKSTTDEQAGGGDAQSAKADDSLQKAAAASDDKATNKIDKDPSSTEGKEKSILSSLVFRLAVLGIVTVVVLLLVFFSKPKEKQDSAAMDPTMEGTMDQAQVDILDLTLGQGTVLESGMTVTIHYKGSLEDGTVFDSSYDRGSPFSFVLGTGKVIPGWEQGLLGMKVGGKRKLTIPPSLAYGDMGYPPSIPSNATLVFEVEAVGAESAMDGAQ